MIAILNALEKSYTSPERVVFSISLSGAPTSLLPWKFVQLWRQIPWNIRDVVNDEENSLEVRHKPKTANSVEKH